MSSKTENAPVWLIPVTLHAFPFCVTIDPRQRALALKAELRLRASLSSHFLQGDYRNSIKFFISSTSRAASRLLPNDTLKRGPGPLWSSEIPRHIAKSGGEGGGSSQNSQFGLPMESWRFHSVNESLALSLSPSRATFGEHSVPSLSTMWAGAYRWGMRREIRDA